MVDGKHTVRRDVRWGVRWGVYYAAAFSAVALFATAVRAVVASRNATEAVLSLIATIAVYGIGGILGGAIVGLFRRFLDGCTGAVLVGGLATVPAAYALRVALLGLADWTPIEVAFFGGFGVFWGGTMAFALWVTRDKSVDST